MQCVVPFAVELRAGLESLVEDYNAAIRRQEATTRSTWVFLVVPALAGAGLDAITGGRRRRNGNGHPSSIFFDRVKTRFPLLQGNAGRASYHPGSAVEGMLAIAGPADPPA